jgi:hypothetical protein
MGPKTPHPILLPSGEKEVLRLPHAAKRDVCMPWGLRWDDAGN